MAGAALAGASVEPAGLIGPERELDPVADAELYISLSTVKTHLGSLMGKLGVRNRVELALWAYQTRRLD